jgi:hypothetical protein
MIIEDEKDLSYLLLAVLRLNIAVGINNMIFRSIKPSKATHFSLRFVE